MTRRRWIADEWSQSSALLRGDQARHLALVLRAAPGTEYEVATAGRVWLARIRTVSPDQVDFDLLQELQAETPLPITLLLSVFKFDRMEWAIEKATELGVDAIAPVIARRTEKHLAQAAARRADRWARIAREAAQQCRRTAAPSIAEPAPLRAALAAHTQATRLLLAEHERDTPLLSALPPLGDHPASLALAIGPEGGWTSDELQLFSAAAWQPVTLGPRILRAETAAIAALAICGAILSRPAAS